MGASTSHAVDGESNSLLLDFSKCCTCAADEFPNQKLTRSRICNKDAADTKKKVSGDSTLNYESLHPAYTHQTLKNTASETSHDVDYREVVKLNLQPEWTAAEKQLINYALDSNPRPISRKLCKKNVPEFMTWMKKISKFVPGKTADDCAAYYLRLQSSRVAYFGPSSSMTTIHQK